MDQDTPGPTVTTIWTVTVTTIYHVIAPTAEEAERRFLDEDAVEGVGEIDTQIRVFGPVRPISDDEGRSLWARLTRHLSL